MSRKAKMFCRCGEKIAIVRQGRGHRLFVCPRCGVIASNPLPLAALAAGAAKVAGSYLAWKAMDKLTGRTSKKIPPEIVEDSELNVVEALKKGALSTFEKAILAELADKRR